MLDEVTHKVSPGRGIGPFALGSPINSIVVDILLGRGECEKTEDNGSGNGGKEVAREEMGKSASYGGTVNVMDRWCSGELCCMEVTNSGMRLYFCRKFQYLVGIEVYDVSRLSLSLGGQKQSSGKKASKSEILTYGDFYDVFGPTVDYPANKERREKALVYPGMLVLFECDPDWGEGTDWLRRAHVKEIVVMDGRIEAVDKGEALRTDVYVGGVKDRNNDDGDDGDEETAGSGGAKAVMDVYRQLGDVVEREEERCVPSCVLVVLGMGILVVDHSANNDAFSDPEDDMVRFGDSHQEVLGVLGEPDGVMRKCGQKQDEVVWNYFTRGIDIVFDKWSHIVMMIVVHTNQIAHAEFGNYYRCFFEIMPSLELGDDLCSRVKESMGLTDKQESGNKNDEDSSSSAWVSAGSSPSLGSNFGPDIAKEERIQKKQKKKKKKPRAALNNKSTGSESSEGEHGSGGFPSRTFLDYTSSLDNFICRLGDCGQPAIIYWDSLSDNQSSKQQLGQTHLYKFKNVHAEFTKDGEVAALYLFKD